MLRIRDQLIWKGKGKGEGRGKQDEELDSRKLR